jgi:hypothetical protein
MTTESESGTQPGWTLTVFYLLNGHVNTDVRHNGVNFRWRVHEGVLNVVEHDADHQIVWTKCYMFPISADLSRP